MRAISEIDEARSAKLKRLAKKRKPVRKSTARWEKDNELLRILRAPDTDAAVEAQRDKFAALDRRLRRKAWVDKNITVDEKR